MGRIAAALKVLAGRAELADDTRYILRAEVPGLTAQLAEMEVAIASGIEKLNALAARQRKREQRASDAPGAALDAPEAPEALPAAQSQQDVKAALRARLFASRLTPPHMRNGV